MKIDKNETYEQMLARQKAERQAMKKRLAEKEQQEKKLAAERLVAVLRIFHDGKTDMEIAAMYIENSRNRLHTTDAGYEFAGLTVNGTAVADADTVTAGQLYKLTVKSNENAPANTYAIAVTAAPKSYNVIWDANGGEFAEGKKSMTTSVAYDTEIAKLDAEPTREGYKFVGWTGFVEGTKIGTTDVTYKAAWEIQSYTIKWIVEGETIKEETLEYVKAWVVRQSHLAL